MQVRIEALRRKFRSLGVSNFIITKFSDIHHESAANISYLTGFTGSNALLLVTHRSAYLVTDGRYTNQAREQTQGVEIFEYSGGSTLADGFVLELKKNPKIRFWGRTGFEVGKMTVDFFQRFSQNFPSVHLIETRDVVERIASVKDEDEVAATRRACAVTDRVFESLIPEVRPGISELDLAAEITYRHMKFGAEKDAFEPIVASGERSALPHARASARKIRKGDFVTFDIGCFADGYASDMTRTVVVGKAAAEQKRIYEIVAEAQAKAAEAVAAGVRCADVDGIARTIIMNAGYGERFTHSLGHGLGREVHGFPRLSKTSTEMLTAGQIVTVEPGIYIEGFGGVRIEDDVVVRPGGREVLNRSPKQLLEL